MRFIVIGGGCYGTYHSGQLYKAIQKGKLPADTELIIVDRNAAPRAMSEHAGKSNFRYVQSDWLAYLINFFGDRANYDPARDGETVQIVPAPFAPHLMFDWLRDSITKALAEIGRSDIELVRDGFEDTLHLPFESTSPEKNHFMSRAGWMCPTTCIEPRLCPAIKDVRDWDLDNDLRQYVAGYNVAPSLTAAAKLQAGNMANGTTQVLTPVTREFAGVENFTCHHYTHGIGTTPAKSLFESRQRTLNLALTLTPETPTLRVAIGTVSRCHGVVASLRMSLTVEAQAKPGNPASQTR
jgi:hypothetical protein